MKGQYCVVCVVVENDRRVEEMSVVRFNLEALPLVSICWPCVKCQFLGTLYIPSAYRNKRGIRLVWFLVDVSRNHLLVPERRERRPIYAVNVGLAVGGESEAQWNFLCVFSRERSQVVAVGRLVSEVSEINVAKTNISETGAVGDSCDTYVRAKSENVLFSL